MNTSVSTGAVAADAAQAARGNGAAAKRSDAHQGGFSDLLSKAGSSSHNDASADSLHPAGGDAQAAKSESGAGTAAPTVHERPRSRPVIALRDASFKQQASKQPETGANATGKPGKDKMAGGGDTAEETPDVNGDRTDSGKVAEKTEAHAASGAKPAKTPASRTGEDKKADSDSSPASASGPTSAADVLGLLNRDAPDTRIIAAIPLVHVNAKNDTAGGKAGSGVQGAASIERMRGAEAPEAGAAHAALAAISANGDNAQKSAVDGAADTDGRTFRLSRADGRGQSVDMHIGADQGSSASGKARNDGESVTVLDSRRFIGLAQNSASITAAITGDSEWTQAMQPGSALSNAAEWTSTGKVVNTLKIQMTPNDLGLVTATMRLSGDALNVDLRVETGAAYRQLKEDHDKIIEALRSQGYTVDNVTISMAPVEKPDAGNQANPQGQSSQHQQSLQQGQGGEARERHAPTRSSNGGVNSAGETNVEDIARGAASSSAPGGVYL